MAGKEKHCSFNPKPVLQSIIFSSRHHADSPSQGERAVGSPSLPPLTFSLAGGRDGGDEFSRVHGGTSINGRRRAAVGWYRCQ